jgi:ABC-type transporter Mla subunit MlaD
MSTKDTIKKLQDCTICPELASLTATVSALDSRVDDLADDLSAIKNTLNDLMVKVNLLSDVPEQLKSIRKTLFGINGDYAESLVSRVLTHETEYTLTKKFTVGIVSFIGAVVGSLATILTNYLIFHVF